jgi:ATP-dependent RNA circularization protein (DNA/RNA ligase family)
MLATDVIKSIEEIDNNSLRYDITVLDNHNFFADEILVHNCQNIFYTDEIQSRLHEAWVVEEKMDGSSLTVGKRGQDIHVCSRNLSIKPDDDTNSFVATAKSCGILDAIAKYPRDIAISGELCGEGIQKNRYNIKGQQWFVFDIFDVEKQSYVSWGERQRIIGDLVWLGATLRQVPCIFLNTELTGHTVDSLLALAEGKAWHNTKTEREGLVFKNINNPNISFKAISNKFLLKNE